MSWCCQMIDHKRRCMKWSDYVKTGWDTNKSFPVKQVNGVFIKEGNNK